MTLMMKFVAPMLTGMPMEIAAMLGEYTMGVVVFPIAYGFLPGTPIVKGLSFRVVLWIAAVVIGMPIAGAGFLMANIGGMVAVMASLMGHLVYGGLLGGLVGGGAMMETAEHLVLE